MPLEYQSMDPTVRQHILAEFNNDLADDTLYISGRLSPEGVGKWPDLLRQAIMTYDDAWLAMQLDHPAFWNARESRRTPSGGMTTTAVPRNANVVLAESEFNRFYGRGLCLVAQAAGESQVEVYRGKPVWNPRPDSGQKIGTRLDVTELLRDLRDRKGLPTILGVPAGPNSGLTVRRTA